MPHELKLDRVLYLLSPASFPEMRHQGASSSGGNLAHAVGQGYLTVKFLFNLGGLFNTRDSTLTLDLATGIPPQRLRNLV